MPLQATRAPVDPPQPEAGTRPPDLLGPPRDQRPRRPRWGDGAALRERVAGVELTRRCAVKSNRPRRAGPEQATLIGLRSPVERTGAYKCATPRAADNP